jgi:hypothetical protein
MVRTKGGQRVQLKILMHGLPLSRDKEHVNLFQRGVIPLVAPRE